MPNASTDIHTRSPLLGQQVPWEKAIQMWGPLVKEGLGVLKGRTQMSLSASLLHLLELIFPLFLSPKDGGGQTGTASEPQSTQPCTQPQPQAP